MRVARGILLIAMFLPTVAAAQAEVSLYGGTHRAADSRVSGNDPGGIGAFGFDGSWAGSSANDQPDYGLRLTWWQNQSFGWGVDLSRSQNFASDKTLTNNNLNTLKFSGEVNIVTVNAYRRWKQPTRRLSPYVGAGFGLAVPRVGFESGGGKTSEYQVTGPAVQWVAGASYSITERVSLFGEYKGSYSVNSADLVSGGQLDSNVLTSAVNVGVSLGF